MLPNVYQSSGRSLLRPSRAGCAPSVTRASQCRASAMRVVASAIPSRRVDGAAAASDILLTEPESLQEPALTAPVTLAPNTATTAPNSPTAAPAVEGPSSCFLWLTHWYPVHVLDELDPARPHAIELLGKQLVLWRDAQDDWQCFDDACPHRLAPLSEGRVEADGTIMCSYHGWKFSGDGACVDIPQAISEKQKAVACSCKRARAVRYPTRQAYGLVWVWPTSGPAAEVAAGATPLPITTAVKEFWDSGKQVKWFRRELEYSYDILVENLVDPAHVPWAHHNLNPNTSRTKGGPMIVKPVKMVPNLEGSMPTSSAGNGMSNGAADTSADHTMYKPIVLEHNTQEVAPGAGTGAVNGASGVVGSNGRADARPLYMHADTDPLGNFQYGTALAPAGAHMAFTPPCSSACQYTLGPGHLCRSELMAVPASPGKSVAITMLEMTDVPKLTAAEVFKSIFMDPGNFPAMLQRFLRERRPLYEDHLQANTLFDQDMVFLNAADRVITRKGKLSWPRSYYMPTPSDAAVMAARRWFDKSLQLPLNPDDPTSPPASSVISLSAESAAAAAVPRHQQMDRYSQHTKHCKICQQAMQKLEQQLGILKAAALICGAAAAGLVAADAVLLSAAVVHSSVDGCETASGVACVAQQLMQSAMGNGVVAAAGGVGVFLGVAAVVCAAWGKAVQEKLQQFTYVEFYHADNN